jgi:hypothetical protein
MHYQYAWLDLCQGIWQLLTGRSNAPTRRWISKDIALVELTQEGWTITGPYPKRSSKQRDSQHKICGYGLMRVVH